MATLTRTRSFKKSYKKLGKQGRDMDELKKVAGLLLSGSPLPPEYLDHPLKGNWKGWRDCHIQPDWILIYKWKPEEELVLGETGSHSELF